MGLYEEKAGMRCFGVHLGVFGYWMGCSRLVSLSVVCFLFFVSLMFAWWFV